MTHLDCRVNVRYINLMQLYYKLNATLQFHNIMCFSCEYKMMPAGSIINELSLHHYGYRHLLI